VVPVYQGWRYFPNNRGLVSGIILCGFGFGAFVFNMISTAVVNPNHEESKDGVFPKDVANNVPNMIRVLTYCWLGLAVAGIALFFPY
jgi:MFS transporter, OFA family, oxalate/formate antiporter